MTQISSLEPNLELFGVPSVVYDRESDTLIVISSEARNVLVFGTRSVAKIRAALAPEPPRPLSELIGAPMSCDPMQMDLFGSVHPN